MSFRVNSSGKIIILGGSSTIEGFTESFPATGITGILAGTAKYIGASLWGNNIYSFPYTNASSVLKFNTLTNVVTFITASDKYEGSVLGFNGKIYGIPSSGNTIAEFDPITDTISYFGSVAIGTQQYAGGVLAPNQMIYCIPKFADKVLKINPITRTVSLIGGSLGAVGGVAKYAGGVLGTNGKIYAVSRDATNILKIDPTTDSVTTFGSLAATSNKYYGGVLATDNNIYFLPLSLNNVLKLDTSNDTFTTISLAETGSILWAGGTTLPNGKILATPHNTNKLLQINTNPLESNFYNLGSTLTSSAFISMTLAPNGGVYSVPFNETRILKLTPNITFLTSSDMFNLPANPLDLPTSLYNKFQNKL